MGDVFKGLKVIELASVLAGPAVGMFFAELGAEVIKIENARTRGDVTRHWKTPLEDADAETSAYFHSVNWGKKHLMLDLRRPETLDQVHELIREADVVISNFKAGSAQKLGLDYKKLKQLNPKIIYGNISAYGKDDPRPGFDAAIQAETGWIYMNGEAEGLPCKLPVALVDILAAHQLKEGILVALLRREKSGKGCEVSVSLFDSAVASLANQASNWLNMGHLPQRMGSLHPNIAPYGEILYTKDQIPLLLATGTESHFKGLCHCLGTSNLSEDERFRNNENRLKNRKSLQSALAAAFAHFTVEELMPKFREFGIPVSPIRNLQEVFKLPEASSLVLEEQTGTENSKRVKTVVFKLSE